MQLSTLVLVASFGSIAACDYIQINVFKNGDCTNYMTSFDPYTDGTCYNWDWNGSNSDGIVDCSNESCYCYFYTLPDCGGSYQYFSGTGGCASNGGGWQSVKCNFVQYVNCNCKLRFLLT